MLFTGKVALVTGGGSGIGRATAEAFGKAGAWVVIGNRNIAQGEEVVAAIRKAGGEALFQKTDVTRTAEVRALVETAVHKFGKLDIAFNNAGFEGKQLSLHEQTEEDADYVLDVNVKGIFRCMKYEIAQMLQTGGGAIVNCGSVFSLGGYANWSVYVGSKHAIAGMTKAAALEYATRGIRINAVAPGPIETEMLRRETGGNPHVYAEVVAMKRIGQPHEVAGAVVWLCSEEASYVTGHILPVDGGYIAQ